MIVCREALEDFVQALVCKGPESIYRPEVAQLIENMTDPVVVGLHVGGMDLNSKRYRA